MRNNFIKNIKIFDSLSGKIEEFHTINFQTINLYVCGITVYDYCHIGHARTMVFFDTIIRYFKYIGYKVNYIRNITDIDDKIIDRLCNSKMTLREYTDFFINEMHNDFKRIGLINPDYEPRATDFINEIVETIKQLIKLGYAYEIDGSVYYSVSKFLEYGKLSKCKTENLLEYNSNQENSKLKKKSLLDFALWKKTKFEYEPKWNSPWGYGRPGWHIECSVMANECLKNGVDIHGGGKDLIFPHHENEIAQYEAIENKKFSKYWMHCGCLQINKEKMSKSMNNYLNIKDVLKKFSSETIRYFLLTAHYRSKLDYSDISLGAAEESLKRMYNSLRGVNKIDENIFKKIQIEDNELKNKLEKFNTKYFNYMNNDFNIPGAISVLFDISREINISRINNIKWAECFAYLMKNLAASINLLQLDPENFFKNSNYIDGGLSLNEEYIEKLIEERSFARLNKNWEEADNIRRVLSNKNIILEDHDGKTIWRILEKKEVK